MLSLLAIPAVAYLIVTIWLSRGLSTRIKSSAELRELRVDVLVAARNEEHSLPRLFKTLAHQSYPSHLWRVTVVDDRSSDDTVAVIQAWQKRLSNLSYISLDSTDVSVAPKKYALQQAVSQTDGDVILVTDADCIVKERWIEETVRLFSDDTVGLVQGITLYQKSKQTLLWLFQSVDFFSHSVVAAAGIGKSLPINSNANNFSYRREVYASLDGFGEGAKVISGDDDLFLQRVWEQGKWKILFSKNEETVVCTEPVETWRALFEQRKRWGSKTLYYKPIQRFVLAIIFFYYIITSVACGFAVMRPSYWWLPLGLLAIKQVGELLFLLPAVKAWKPPFSLVHMIWASPLQLFVVVYAVVMGVFGTFHWKGETFKRKR